MIQPVNHGTKVEITQISLQKTMNRSFSVKDTRYDDFEVCVYPRFGQGLATVSIAETVRLLISANVNNKNKKKLNVLSGARFNALLQT
uniref:Uncharacterized protein n=1 Tax=Anguilla anguilla TaxID=7936 RepID=A0A0E9V9X6_ANGAN